MVRSDIGCWFKAPVFSCQLPALRMTSNPKEPSGDSGEVLAVWLGERYWTQEVAGLSLM